MVDELNQKIVVLVEPQATLNNGSFTVNVLDTVGWDYVSIYVALGAMDAALTACKLNEADAKASATALTGGTLVPNSDYSVSGTLPTVAADANNVVAWHVQLTAGRKRFLLPVITVGNGTNGAFVTVWATLSRAKQVPNTAALRGLQQDLFC